MQELLSILNLKDGVVTADAMHCQKETVKKLSEKEADYVIQVKGNQRALLDRIKSDMEHYESENYASSKVRMQTGKERNRTREEIRTCIVAPALAELKSRWKGLQTIGLICRTRMLADGTEQMDVTHFIISLAPKVRPHLQHLRNHWRWRTACTTLWTSPSPKTSAEFVKEMVPKLLPDSADSVCLF